MLLPVALSAFRKNLTQDELEALQRNLEFPAYEDARPEKGRKFFKNALSDELVFCRANGECIDKKTFMQSFVNKNRSSSGSVRILNNTDKGLLFSTVVNMADADGVRSFTNVRLLEKKEGTRCCRLWANYEQFGPN
jgi:hypothetical protein